MTPLHVRAAELLEEWAAVLWDSNVDRSGPHKGTISDSELLAEHVELIDVAKRLRSTSAAIPEHWCKSTESLWHSSFDDAEAGRKALMLIKLLLNEPATVSSSSVTEPAHTDHPLRHFDRTCQACITEGETPRTDAFHEEMVEARECSYKKAIAHARQLERKLASAKRDADHFFNLSGKYLERANSAEEKVAALSPTEDMVKLEEGWCYWTHEGWITRARDDGSNAELLGPGGWTPAL